MNSRTQESIKFSRNNANLWLRRIVLSQHIYINKNKFRPKLKKFQNGTKI